MKDRPELFEKKDIVGFLSQYLKTKTKVKQKGKFISEDNVPYYKLIETFKIDSNFKVTDQTKELLFFQWLNNGKNLEKINSIFNSWEDDQLSPLAAKIHSGQSIEEIASILSANERFMSCVRENIAEIKDLASSWKSFYANTEKRLLLKEVKDSKHNQKNPKKIFITKELDNLFLYLWTASFKEVKLTKLKQDIMNILTAAVESKQATAEENEILKTKTKEFVDLLKKHHPQEAQELIEMLSASEKVQHKKPTI